MKLTIVMSLALGLFALSGCGSPSEQPQGKNPYGPEWKAKQAKYEAACVAKGHSASVCEQTNPADEYTDEFRQAMLTNGQAITQCLEGSVASCKLIKDEQVGECMSYAAKGIDPVDDEYQKEQKEICALELQIIREASANVGEKTSGSAPSDYKAAEKTREDQNLNEVDVRADCIKKQLGSRFDNATISETLTARKKCGIDDPEDAEEQLREQRERLSQ